MTVAKNRNYRENKKRKESWKKGRGGRGLIKFMLSPKCGYGFMLKPSQLWTIQLYEILSKKKFRNRGTGG